MIRAFQSTLGLIDIPASQQRTGLHEWSDKGMGERQVWRFYNLLFR